MSVVGRPPWEQKHVHSPRRVVILGAAGRDFHNFNTVYRDNPDFQVVAFTATQIPGIDAAAIPPSWPASSTPRASPSCPSRTWPELIRREKPDVAVFSYSDVTYEHVGHMASLCIALGVDFELLGADKTMIKAKVPVIAITAVRTGAGKSQTTRYISNILKGLGKKVVAIRHPMPYGDLAKQACQRFAAYSDLDLHECTIEEREEYEPHIDNGFIVYCRASTTSRSSASAEKEADVILWDGGNNDLPFYACDLHIVIADPLRPGHELHLPPRRGQFPQGRRHRHQQVRSRQGRGHPGHRGQRRPAEPQGRGAPRRFPGDLRAARSMVRGPAGPSSSRTAPPSPTAP